jgi:hypothetical protein
MVANLHDAYRDPRFKTARYAVLVTGPSATADIEGVLIQGARGVGAGRPQSDGAADLAAGTGSRRPVARISTWQKSTRVFASGALLLWQSRSNY